MAKRRGPWDDGEGGSPIRKRGPWEDDAHQGGPGDQESAKGDQEIRNPPWGDQEIRNPVVTPQAKRKRKVHPNSPWASDLNAAEPKRAKRKASITVNMSDVVILAGSKAEVCHSETWVSADPWS